MVSINQHEFKAKTGFNSSHQARTGFQEVKVSKLKYQDSVIFGPISIPEV